MAPNIIESPKKRDEFKRYIEQNKDKGIIVYSTASWCKPCRTSKPLILETFTKMNDSRKILIILDIDTCRDVSNYLRIRGVPQLFYYENGEPKYAYKGGSPSTIQSFFQKIK